MTDATTKGHRHAHDHAAEAAMDSHGRAASVGPSLLEASAGGRLFMLSLAVAALWAGVFWALH